MLRRFTIAALVAVPLTLSTASALADGPPAPPTPANIEAVSFTMTSQQCSQLPAGVTVKGSGTKRTWLTSSTDANGVTHDSSVSIISGAATDNKGGKYWFDYHDSYNVSHTAPPYVALLTDHFDLVKKGSLAGVVHAMFVGELTVTSEEPFTATLKPTFALGNPLDFATFTPHCDPV
jgi:hypothetical protein